jgi:hypothetical protein
VLTSSQFSTSETVVLEANIGSDFVVDDLELALIGNDETVGMKSQARFLPVSDFLVHSHSLSLPHQILLAKLPPGTNEVIFS